MARHLVYFTVGGDPAYADLLRMAVATVRTRAPEVDLLVLCDTAYAPHVADVPGHRHLTAPNRDGVAASMRKVELFDWPRLRDYDAVLFLDCDIVVAGPLSGLLDGIQHPDLLHVCPEGGPESHAAPSHSLAYGPDELSAFVRDGVRPFNCGQFVLRPSDAMEHHFAQVRALMASWNGPFFYEQSFMNHHFGLARATTPRPLEEATELFARPGSADAAPRTLLHFADTGLHWRLKLAMMRHAAGVLALGPGQAEAMRAFGARLAELDALAVVAASAADAGAASDVARLLRAAGIRARPAESIRDGPVLVVACGPIEGAPATVADDAWRLEIGSDDSADRDARWVARQHLVAIAHVLAEGALAARGVPLDALALSLAARRFDRAGTAADWLRPDPGLPRVSGERTLEEALPTLATHPSRAAVVIDSAGRSAGYLTLATVLRHRASHAARRTPVGALPGVCVPAPAPGDDLDTALHAVEPWRDATPIWPVVDADGRIAGVLELGPLLAGAATDT